MRSGIIGLCTGAVGVFALSGCVYYGPYSYYPAAGGYYSCTSTTAGTTSGNGQLPPSGTADANVTHNALPLSGQNCSYVAVPAPAYYGYPGYYGYPAYYGYPGYYGYPYGYPWPGYYGWWGPSVVIGGYWGGGYGHGGYYGHWHGGHWH
jgi:hypothetical protein